MVLTCNACNADFEEEELQRQHYRSGWHRYNLKRKVAGLPGVTEALFMARQEALAEEDRKSMATPMLYGCSVCGKQYRSSKAHKQHLSSRAHAAKASQGPTSPSAGVTVVKAISEQARHKISVEELNDSSEDDEDEWVEADPDELETESMADVHVDEDMPNFDETEEFKIVPSDCFMCDLPHDSVENCMVHMHKKHGFFIPDIEYLKDPIGLLTYVGLKVQRDFTCLYCNDNCEPFQSLEGVRKHMDAKAHCKLRYGDGSDDEDADLEAFYDYSSSYPSSSDSQLVTSNSSTVEVELGIGGSELILTQRSHNGSRVKALGSREYLRYYRQKPRPSTPRDAALAIALASCYKGMSLATVQSKNHSVRMKVLREMNRRGVEAMRSEIGMKSNVIRNLPKNVPY